MYKRPALPFRGRKRGKLYLISETPHHGNGESMKHKTVLIDGKVLYVHVNRSAPDFVSCLKVLCEEIGVPVSDFSIGLEIQSPTA